MKHARIIVPILVAVIVMGLLKKSPDAPKDLARGEDAPNRPSREYSQAWLPLSKDNVWEYRVTESDKMKTYAWKVARSKGAVHEVLESANGRQIGTYAFDGAEPGLHVRPFALSDKLWQILPPDLEPGVRWTLRKGWRATAETEEKVPLPDGSEATALRVRYEAHYDEDVTKRPGWYFDGMRWFVRGVGIVREDLRGVEVPPDMPRPKGHGGGLKELVHFRVR